MSDWRRDVLTYWFGLTKEQWFNSDPALDAEITERFHDLYERKRELPAASFLDDPLTALAAIILFDQFPRNMFRDHADQFQTDHLTQFGTEEIPQPDYLVRLKEALRLAGDFGALGDAVSGQAALQAISQAS